MALTLTATIGADATELAVTGTIGDEIAAGYRFRLGDEALVMDGFVPLRRPIAGILVEVPGRPIPSRNHWFVRRGQDGSTATSHDAGTAVLGALDAFTSGSDQDVPGPFPAGGPGSTPNLAEVLAQGNDTGGVGIVNDESGTPDTPAVTTLAATASGTGNATADTTASSVDGTASAQTYALASGAGSASATNIASASAGSASSTIAADAATAQVVLESAAVGFGDAKITVSADGTISLQSTGEMTGVTLTITPDGTVNVADLVIVDASGTVKMPGLPTSDPGVAGVLYTAAGVLMVSAG